MNNIEIDFLNKIDCNFPYLNKVEYIGLIEEASKISSNALFSILEEVCRIPDSDRQNVSNEVLFEILSLTEEKINHPLKIIVLETAKKMISNQDLDVDDVLLNMKKIKEYPFQYAALSILYFSCNDEDEKLESVWYEITNHWKN